MLKSQQQGIESLRMLQGRGYTYRLESYASALSELSVRAYKADASGYRIVFQTTFYIQMATDWERGDFQLASPQEHEDLMNRLRCSATQKEQMLLFTVSPSTNPETFLLCHKVLLSQLP